MAFYITTIREASKDIADIYGTTYKNNFQFTERQLNVIEQTLEIYLENFKDEVNVLIEDEYIDKVYRDIYYHYFSTKLYSYPRNCMRISFFDREITEDMFFETAINNMEEYLGFMVIRPTYPRIIGRNVISPKALKESNIKICSAHYPVTVNGAKCEAIGFPHTSQDGEMTSCADVTLWGIMEYLGAKYPEYSTVVPSKIISSLKNMSYERQLPTNGLTTESISYALKECGLSPKIYTKDIYSEDFEKIFRCYIESGFPIITVLESSSGGHAIICIGHVNEDFNNWEKIKPKQESLGNKCLMYDMDSIRKGYVFVDDNFPVYDINFLEGYFKNYPDFQINNFIIPLHPRIYLDVQDAKKQIKAYIFLYLLNIEYEIVLRTFLCPSNLYKQYVAQNEEMDKTFRIKISELQFPKFIWVGEISNPKLVVNKKISGLVILDATETRYTRSESLILISNSTECHYKTKNMLNRIRIGDKVEPWQPFQRFEENIN
jgi:hypothetical protein